VDQEAAVKQPSIVILRRGASPFTKNQGDYRYRRWPKESLPIIISTLKRQLPGHRIDLFSDLNMTLMNCRECQIRMFYEADIVIGIHGAGLTNTVSTCYAAAIYIHKTTGLVILYMLIACLCMLLMLLLLMLLMLLSLLCYVEL
jgi:hypothetical protein